MAGCGGQHCRTAFLVDMIATPRSMVDADTARMKGLCHEEGAVGLGFRHGTPPFSGLPGIESGEKLLLEEREPRVRLGDRDEIRNRVSWVSPARWNRR